MDIFDVLTLFGGVAVFLYGMHVLSESLQSLASGKVERLLRRLTSNLFMAVLLGAGIAAVIQSSSATTVMVVGLVNAGMMNLSQAVGVIMGANIGTTITAWLLSLAGLSTTNPWLKLLSPDGFTPILMAIGVILIFVAKKDRQRMRGEIMIGFGILMMGMKIMSSAVAPLQTDPNFAKFFMVFKNPILGVLAGAILTAIIQSSSASVGILQALAATGQVQWGSAIPIIMGQNIGTCVTALISSLGAKKNAKRAAMIHLLFNLLGSILFFCIFYLIHMLRPFSFLDGQVTAAGIAAFHTAFNVTATALLLPFHNHLVHLSIRIVPEREDKQHMEEEAMLSSEENQLLRPLEQRFLETPALALASAEKVVAQMADLAEDALREASAMIDDPTEERRERVIHHENLMDRLEDNLQTYLLKISQQQLQDDEVVKLNIMMHSINDLERVTDHTVHVADAIRSQADGLNPFSEQAKDEMRVFLAAVGKTMQLTVQYFHRYFDQLEQDPDSAMEIEAMEEVVDTLAAELYQRHIERLRHAECSETTGMLYQDMLAALERISDHCSNIAFYLLEIDNGTFDRHSYNQRAHTGNGLFDGFYKEMKKDFCLPTARQYQPFE